MKYIRTKNGIEKLDADREYLTEYMNGKQANTVEELVDDFIAKKDYGKPFVIKRYEIHSSLQFGFTIYGAIWVVGEDNEPILKPVAIINEKGEMVLL